MMHVVVEGAGISQQLLEAGRREQFVRPELAVAREEHRYIQRIEAANRLRQAELVVEDGLGQAGCAPIREPEGTSPPRADEGRRQ